MSMSMRLIPFVLLLLSASSAPAGGAGGIDYVQARDGAIWVFDKGDPSWDAWKERGSLPDKHVTSFASTAAGLRIYKSPEAETLAAFRARRPGFVTRIANGHVWVFREGRVPAELPDKHVTRMDASSGEVRTWKSPDIETLTAHQASRPGFAAVQRGEHVWIFPAGSEALEQALEGSFSDKHLTRMVAGEGSVRVYKALDALTLSTYLDIVLPGSRPGYVPKVHDGRLWVFEEGGLAQLRAELGDFPDKHVTRMRAAQGGVVVVKAPDQRTLDGWFAARPGHVVRPTVEGAVWVFLPGSPELAAFDSGNISEKHATRVTATEGGVLTMKSDSLDVLRSHSASRGGLTARVRDGHLWIFRSHDPLLADFDAGAAFDKHVTSVASVDGSVRTLKAPDTETIEAYRQALGAAAPLG